MAQVTYTGLTDGSVRSAAAYNALLTPFVTQSTNLGAANYRDEGFDAPALIDDCMTDGRREVEYNAGLANVVMTAHPTFATLVIGATTFSDTNAGAGWAVGQNVGRLRLKFGAMWDFIASNARLIVYFKVQYQIDGGAFTDVPNSEWDYCARPQVAYGPISRTDWYESMAYDWDIPYPSDGASHTINTVRIQVADDAGNTFRFNNVYMRLKRYIKAVT